MSDFESALKEARAERIPVMALRHLEDGSLDDVVVETPTMFRAEMMSESELWLCCYFSNGEHLTFWVHAEKKGVLSFDATEIPDHIDWDELRRR